MSVTAIWEEFLQLHKSGDWLALMPVYGSVLASIILAGLLISLVRGKNAARRALGAAKDVEALLLGITERVDELEHRIEQRMDSRASELDARMTTKMDKKGDLIQERIEQRAATLSDSISRLDARVGHCDETVEQFRERVKEVESRIPGLFDRLDEFRDTLARTFQVELGGVLSSFDNSVGAILHQMKSEMKIGLSRIESIEGMVDSRRAAERALLGDPSTLEIEETHLVADNEPEQELDSTLNLDPKTCFFPGVSLPPHADTLDDELLTQNDDDEDET